jgi:hypothetical protein
MGVCHWSPAPYTFRRHIFTEGRKTLSRSHNDLNITDKNAGLAHCSSASTVLHNIYIGIKIFTLFLKLHWVIYLFNCVW